MKDEDLTKEQLLEEIAKLRQEILEIKLVQNEPEYIPEITELASTSWRFSTGSAELFVTNPPEQTKHPMKYRFSDLVDVPLLQQVFKSFYAVTGIPVSIIDIDGMILSGIGWQDICTRFHRVCPETECRCRESDSYIAAHLDKGVFVGYKCLNGLMDYAAPIIIEEQHLATVFHGQFLHEAPDLEFFRNQAQAYGFDETAYLEALHQVPVIPADQVGSIMEFFSQLAVFLAKTGLERKRQLESVRQRIREQEEQLNLIRKISDNAFWDWNLETGEVYVSPCWIEMLEYTPGEIEPHLSTWDKLLHPDDKAAVFMAVGEHLEGRTEKYEVECRQMTKSGEWKWMMAHGHIVARNEQGQPVRMTGINLDITDRKKNEAALRQSEQKFLKAFQCNPDLMAISTLKEGRYIEVNDAFVAITGYHRHEILGHTSEELGIWAVPEERDNLIRKIQEYGSIKEFELKLRLKSGEIRTFCLSGEIIEIDGKQHLLNTSQDITERRQMELEMKRLDRLNLVGEMAASIGHEIRNPLTAVRGYLQFLQENEDYQQELEYFDLMIEELDRANSIISEFLALAKNRMLELKPGNLNAIITKLWPLIQAKAMSHDQFIKLDLGEIPDFLLDKKEIPQLIINLINNSLEAMQSGGEVAVRTCWEGENVVLTVQDQGHGIDPDLLDKLGTPFFSTKEQGTGLGLAVCYRIATRHKAKIDIDTSSSGTTFFVRFPIPNVSIVEC